MLILTILQRSTHYGLSLHVFLHLENFVYEDEDEERKKDVRAALLILCAKNAALWYSQKSRSDGLGLRA